MNSYQAVTLLSDPIQKPLVTDVSRAVRELALMMRFAKALYVCLCLETLFAIAYRGTFLLTHRLLLAWLAAAVIMAFAAACFRFREALLNGPRSIFPLRWAGTKAWLLCWLALGLLLRMAWVLRFPTTLKSDGAAYFGIALRLAGYSYTGAYWPPGLPLFLAPMMMLWGAHPWVTALASMLLFLGTGVVVWLLALQLAGRQAAGISIVLLAVWPGYFTVGGTNCKEGLIAFLLPSAMLLYYKAFQKERASWGLLACSGIVMGFATLTQPGFLLFPAVMLAVEVMRRTRLTVALVRAAAFGLAMLLAVLPWTYRNYRVLHRPVLISVNGGSTFYLANNPLANAAYEPEGAVRLPDDVFESNRVGYIEGKKWIREHPVTFLVLGVRKQIVYLGDDGIGPYETLKRGEDASGPFYAIIKAVCSAWWLGIWIVLLIGMPRLFRREIGPWYGLCFLPNVFQWLIDSVFISASRHHLSFVGFFVVLAGMAIALREDVSL